jgi:LAO/AO transport system kinase
MEPELGGSPGSGEVQLSRRALARLISVLEAGGPAARTALRDLYPRAGQAHVVGLTGAPGSGKSTLVGALARAYRARGSRVAVLAVDPTSPYSGGALLGDRVRMPDLAGDPGVFVRSMASRGALGGLALAASKAVAALDAAGYARILVETVGVGQDEVAVARTAHTTVVVTVPGLGDEVQALKAGLLEVADVLVVNKADRPDAERARAELVMLQSLASPAAWQPPVLSTVATRAEGVADLLEAVEAHRSYLETSGEGARRAAERARTAVLASAEAELAARLERVARESRWEAAWAAVAAHERTPDDVAHELLEVLVRSAE